MAMAVLTSLGLAGANVAGQDRAPDEYQMKAAFLFHFAQFVEWPATAFKDASSPMNYCTVGVDPFRGALEESLRGKMVGAHPLSVQHLKSSEPLQDCQILFIAAAETKRTASVLANLNASPVLTVGESEGFALGGGMIAFCREGNKIRFDINLAAANAARLKISARLLALAKNVIGDPRGN